MLIKRIRTRTRPSTDIPWVWTDDETNQAIVDTTNLEQSLVESGVISSISVNVSEDGLTHVKEYSFSSIVNLVSYKRQTVELDASTGYLTNELQHFANNGITFTTAYVFER